MLHAIREFFDRNLSAPAATGERDHSLEVATAALLVEVVRADRDIDDAERAAVIAAIREKFHLTEEEADRLTALAEEESKLANDYYQFTALINEHFDQPTKVRVVELMWGAAYADGRLDAHEQHVLRRIADLLHVAHPDYINAKLKARRAAGVTG